MWGVTVVMPYILWLKTENMSGIIETWKIWTNRHLVRRREDEVQYR